MYRYARGQTGQGSLPRPAWGSGGHGARAASPEPGGPAGTPLFNSGEQQRDRLGTTPQDEAILQLERELDELRNACAWKDQRIADLSRTDTTTARLKKDIRQLASELHHTRKQLADSLGELQAGAAARSDGVAMAAARDVADSPSAGANADVILSAQLAELQEENRQLRETVQKMTAARDQSSFDGVHHARQPSGASTQRSSEQHLHPGIATAAGLPGGALPRAAYLVGPTAGQQAAGALGTASQEEPLQPIVYSTIHTENIATIGPTTLQGVGTVDGVSSVAKVLLQRIHSSVCAAHRRPVGAALAVPGQPHG